MPHCRSRRSIDRAEREIAAAADHETAGGRQHAGGASRTEQRRQRDTLQLRMPAELRHIAERHAPLDRAAVQIDRHKVPVRRLEQRQAVHELGVGAADQRDLGIHFRRARVRRGFVGLPHPRDVRLVRRFHEQHAALWIERAAAPVRAAEVDADLTRVGDTNAEFMDGLPLLKPPYGHLVAIDLNRGAIKWRVPFGDTPSVRRHPALKDVALPPTLGVAGAPGVLATAGGLVIGGGGDLALHAIDAATGAEIWKAPLPRRVNATPMTYRTSRGRQVIVAATGGGEDAALVAFALPAAAPSSGQAQSGGKR